MALNWMTERLIVREVAGTNDGCDDEICFHGIEHLVERGDRAGGRGGHPASGQFQGLY